LRNKQLFAYVNHARICFWNQPVLSNESKISCSRKQRGPLMGLELTTDMYPPITSQTRYSLLLFILKSSQKRKQVWYVLLRTLLVLVLSLIY